MSGGKDAIAGTLFSLSEQETFDIGFAFGKRLNGGELILLIGELGIGKTVFTRGLAAGLGIAPEDVCSPSYTLVQEYTGGSRALFHIDLYRIERPEEIGTLGLEDLLDSGAVVVVEWGERLPQAYTTHALTVRFHDIGEASRRLELFGPPEPDPPPHHDA